MSGWQVVGAVGRTMIRTGALLLLFVTYQLWGTGLATDRAQDSLNARFRELQQGIPAISDPATAPTDFPIPEPGDPIGRIEIPRIDVDFIMVQNVDL